MPDMESLSVILMWTAIAIYALAFVAYAFDLASRSAQSADAKVGAVVKQPVAAGAGGTLVDEGADAAASGPEASDSAPAKPRFVMARIGTSLTVLAWLFHLAGAVTRGIADGHVPWSNLYEFTMVGTLLIIGVYLLVLTRLDVRYLGSFILGLVVVLLGLASTNFYVAVTPLAEPLKSVWLIIHVFVASLSTALFALAFALSVMQLLQMRRESRLAEGVAKTGPGFLRTIPDSTRLESLAYRFTVVGFIAWTFTLIAGAIWADAAWGRFWGFDVKETWTFIIWVLYAGYIHARATRGWRGSRSAWLSIVGFSAVIFNSTIVNIFFKGLHSYSGLS